ncbi:MAG TPA: metallophosphoesterase, partial [Lacipirellulaceae bacterium]|nr:metallophosphoesterase [Lacipirellulaceae bacterium]
MPISSPDPPDAAAPGAVASATLSRRRFLRRLAGGGASAAVGTLLYTWRVEPHWVDIVQRPLPVAALPERLVGKRLIQLSDLHVGPVVDQSFLLRSVQRLAHFKPDLLVITGDLMSCHAEEQVDRVLEVIAEVPSAPLGRFAIFGNHDYGDRWKQHQAANMLARKMERLDVRVLRNETASAGGLQIAGVDDLWARKFEPRRAIEQLDPGGAMLALCHNPDGVDQPGWEGFRGWILAGHTHGGQCKAPFLR